jgi:multisubunit Na+/H+ antiporter MnhB subunit
MSRLVTSFIFRTVVQFLFFIINIFALYLMLRGHNGPGGGFIAGLATGISLILLSLGVGMEQLGRYLRFDPIRLAASGLLLAALTSLAPVFGGQAFLAHVHVHAQVPLLGELHAGTPILFDGGVYLVVVGISCKIILLLGKSTLGLVAFTPSERARYGSPLERDIEEPDEQRGGTDAA